LGYGCGLEEGGLAEGKAKKCPVDTFLAGEASMADRWHPVRMLAASHFVRKRKEFWGTSPTSVARPVSERSAAAALLCAAGGRCSRASACAGVDS